MALALSTEQQEDLLRRGYSRRTFGRIATLLTAGATLPFYNEHALAQMSRLQPVPEDGVKINANENPLGPCPTAIDAIYNVAKKGGRYMFEATDTFSETMANSLGVKFSPDVKENYIQVFPGSSAP
ncbi:MAG: hypothetical protein JO211_04725, partial [Acidobacteriaceae bacterium]|nr:hypothetical protein [Acidobacteriaceae bacterium]